MFTGVVIYGDLSLIHSKSMLTGHLIYSLSRSFQSAMKAWQIGIWSPMGIGQANPCKLGRLQPMEEDHYFRGYLVLQFLQDGRRH